MIAPILFSLDVRITLSHLHKTAEKQRKMSEKNRVFSIKDGCGSSKELNRALVIQVVKQTSLIVTYLFAEIDGYSDESSLRRCGG